MLQRWLVVIVGLPLLLALLLACPPWGTLLVVAAIAAAAAYEMLHTAAGQNVPLGAYAAVVLAAAGLEWAVYACFSPRAPGAAALEPGVVLWPPLVLVTVLFALAVGTHGRPGALSFTAVSAGMMGGAVLPVMYSAVLLLRLEGDYGRAYVLLPFAVAFAGDSFSMYGGMLFGKKKMAPAVSPHKTWAGAWAGMLGGGLGLVLWGLVARAWLGYQANCLLLGLVGAAANALGQLGDLAMSLVKREAGVKDFSRLFLTHGGMLDRFDSTLLIAPWLYLLVCAGVL